MDFAWTEAELRYRAAIRGFLKDELSDEWWSTPMRRTAGTEEYPEEECRTFVRRLAAEGWLTPHWPEEYGGKASTVWEHLILTEEMGRVGEPRGPAYMNVNWVGPAIMYAGTDEQKSYHLDRISRGDVFWCQGFSEPDAGSDLASLRTRAVREGDEYVINGVKVWTSHTQMADYCFLLVRTGPQDDKRHGITILLVPTDTPGMEIRPIPSFIEPYAFAECSFRDARVPVSARLGGEGEGWDIVRSVLVNERSGADRYERASLTLDVLAESAVRSGLFDQAEFLQLFGEARAVCEAARWLSYRGTNERAHDRTAVPYAYFARVGAVVAERHVAEVGFDAMGPESLAFQSPAENIFRDGIAGGLAGGSLEIQLNQIAREMLGSRGR
jgi:alkylation response protein AidB-like acyl-CoA dehydrogenase